MNLSVEFLGLTLRNPLILASGNLATNAATTLAAMRAGVAMVMYKTITNDPFRTVNVGNRFGHFPHNASHADAWWRQNIEGITEHTLAKNEDEFKRIVDERPDGALLGISIMAPPTDFALWEEVMAVAARYADLIEVNHGCPQDVSERGMGAAVGRNAALVERVATWTTRLGDLYGKPVIHKLTPNDCDPREPGLAALSTGAHGLSAINTVRGIVGIDRATGSPMPTVGGMSVFGGLSGPAVRPIGLRICAELAQMMRVKGYQDRVLLGMGGIDSGYAAAEYMMVGCNAVQLLTALWNHPDKYGRTQGILEELVRYLKERRLDDVNALRGEALSKLTTHGALVELDGRSREHLAQ